MNPEAEAALAAGAQKTAYTAALTGGGLTWITSDVIFGLLGLLVAIIGTGVSIWIRLDARKREKATEALDNARAEELHRAKLDYLRRARGQPGELYEASLLGIDTSDFGKLEGQDG